MDVAERYALGGLHVVASCGREAEWRAAPGKPYRRFLGERVAASVGLSSAPEDEGGVKREGDAEAERR